MRRRISYLAWEISENGGIASSKVVSRKGMNCLYSESQKIELMKYMRVFLPSVTEICQGTERDVQQRTTLDNDPRHQ